MASEYRYMVCRQHAGTGFPMGVQYATGNRKEANAAAKAMAGRAELDVYYSVNDAANSAARALVSHHAGPSRWTSVCPHSLAVHSGLRAPVAPPRHPKVRSAPVRAQPRTGLIPFQCSAVSNIPRGPPGLPRSPWKTIWSSSTS